MMGYKAHHNLALSYEALSRWDEAEQSLRAAVTDNPAFDPSWMALGDLYLRIGQVRPAWQIVAKLRELAPGVAVQMESELMRNVANTYE